MFRKKLVLSKNQTEHFAVYFKHLDVLVFDHLPTTIVSDNEPLSYEIFDNVFENKIIQDIFFFPIGAIHIKH